MFKKRRIKYVATLCSLVGLLSISGVYAAWNYCDKSPENVDAEYLFTISEFNYHVEEVPKGEVTLIERLDAILNQRYVTDIVTDSRDYLINETIQVRWEPGADPYVGSMDSEYAEQIDALFGDIVLDEGVSFILKNQDLNWDGLNEISLYSTSDPLDCVEQYDGVVCVHVTVFTPFINEQKEIIGYNQVCDSIHGYCCEVYYASDDPTPSFSTDEWRDDLGYYHVDGNTYKVPDNAMNLDGTKLFKYDHDSYTREYWYEGCPWPGRTLPLGKRANELLWDKIPWIDLWS